MNKVFTDENNIYQIDCSKAVWATDQVYDAYHNAAIHLNDADFMIENEANMILMVEYKNANIPGAANPDAFKPEDDRKILNVTRKFYDSLHYLWLQGKTEPVQFVYVLEYPNGDVVTRKRLRNKLKKELPFQLQNQIGDGRKLIDKVEVLSIEEWNLDKNYGIYPFNLCNR